MLTVRYDWLGLRPGDRVLDLGCGAGRHAFEAWRRDATVVALDHDAAELKDVAAMFAALALEDETGAAGERPERAAPHNEPPEPDAPAAAGARLGAPVNGDAGRLPFSDAAFDRVIAAEVLEHLPDDIAALGELARVLRPGGTIAVTVPAWFPERICWALSSQYHAPHVDGGHVRIYRRRELLAKLRGAGLVPTGSHHAHALHAPYWWLRCAVGPADDQHPLVRAYHRILVHDIMRASPATRVPEWLLNPLLGKSLVIYATKPGPNEEPTR